MVLCSQNEGGRFYIQSKRAIVQTFSVIPTADLLVIAGVAFGDFFTENVFQQIRFKNRNPSAASKTKPKQKYFYSFSAKIYKKFVC